jgi:peroxiredoxin
MYYAFLQTSILLLLFVVVASAEKIDSLPQAQFPEKIADINGRLIDVGKLAGEKTVTVVTLKATWCPVCQEQLIRLKDNLHLINTDRVTFLVLSPGPQNELLEIKKNTGFPYPFIEDKKLRITKSLGLDMSEKEITPSIFILNKNRNIRWMQRGRSGWYYGDEELLNEIGIVNWM